MGYKNSKHSWSAKKGTWSDVYKGASKAVTGVRNFFQNPTGKGVFFNPDKSSLSTPKNVADRIYNKGYDPKKSWLPLYDELFKYKDRVKMMEDLAKRGIKPAYGSRRPDFGALGDYVQSLGGEVRKATYKVGNLYKKL